MTVLAFLWSIDYHWHLIDNMWVANWESVIGLSSEKMVRTFVLLAWILSSFIIGHRTLLHSGVLWFECEIALVRALVLICWCYFGR